MLGSPDNDVPVLKTPEARRRRVLMPLFIALVVGLTVVAGMAAFGRPGETLTGSGSTLAQPLIERAAKASKEGHAADNPARRSQTGQDWVVNGGGVDYEPVGSLGGLLRLGDNNVDFAVADYPLSADELGKRNLVQFPIAVGAIAVVHNLDLPEGQRLKLDAPTLARVYSGEITTWKDPAIAALNQGVGLPDGPIVPVHRTDGSGSTFGFTGYLSRAEGWKGGVGSLVNWPEDVGRGAERTGGVLDAVKTTPGALGYLDQGQATRAGLKTADLRNNAGAFVAPTKDAMAAAIAGADFSGGDDYVKPLAGATDAAAYPGSVAIYAMVRHEDSPRTRQVLGFLSYVVDEYDEEASDLGYLPLPATAADAVKAYWTANLGFKN